MRYVALTRRFGNRFKTIYLHRLIYQLAFGKVPKNKDVHHKDFNTLNCKDNNFELRPRGTHSAMVL